MISRSKAKIYLADERGHQETDWFRSCHTFNFGAYFNVNKHPPGDLYVLNDDTLDGGRSLRMLVEERSFVILVPVMGAIAYKEARSKEQLVAAGQALTLVQDKGVEFEIRNPFEEGLINFLQIWIRAGEAIPPSGPCLRTCEDVNRHLNELLSLSPDENESVPHFYSVSIGKFSGRGETVYARKYGSTGIFLFVIEGAFEVEGRLLHARDGLALLTGDTAEIEALSQNALMLVVETGLT